MTNKLIALVLAVSSVAFAQKSDEPKTAPKPQVVTFGEGSEIEAGILLPSMSYTLVKDSPRFHSLIKVRTDFNDKLAASVYEM